MFAGWGIRYDLRNGVCMTNSDMKAPAHNKECLGRWTAGGKAGFI